MANNFQNIMDVYIRVYFCRKRWQSKENVHQNFIKILENNYIVWKGISDIWIHIISTAAIIRDSLWFKWRYDTQIGTNPQINYGEIAYRVRYIHNISNTVFFNTRSRCPLLYLYLCLSYYASDYTILYIRDMSFIIAG